MKEKDKKSLINLGREAYAASVMLTSLGRDWTSQESKLLSSLDQLNLPASTCNRLGGLLDQFTVKTTHTSLIMSEIAVVMASHAIEGTSASRDFQLRKSAILLLQECESVARALLQIEPPHPDAPIVEKALESLEKFKQEEESLVKLPEKVLYVPESSPESDGGLILTGNSLNSGKKGE